MSDFAERVSFAGQQFTSGTGHNERVSREGFSSIQFMYFTNISLYLFLVRVLAVITPSRTLEFASMRSIYRKSCRCPLYIDHQLDHTAKQNLKRSNTQLTVIRSTNITHYLIYPLRAIFWLRKQHIVYLINLFLFVEIFFKKREAYVFNLQHKNEAHRKGNLYI